MVGVNVGVEDKVSVFVGVLVRVLESVLVAVCVGVNVAVGVGVNVGVFVGERVGVWVMVFVGVGVNCDSQGTNCWIRFDPNSTVKTSREPSTETRGNPKADPPRSLPV